MDVNKDWLFEMTKKVLGGVEEGGVQGGCEQTIEGGVRVDVNKQLKLLQMQ